MDSVTGKPFDDSSNIKTDLVPSKLGIVNLNLCKESIR
jgi:hypothetical protein